MEVVVSVELVVEERIVLDVVVSVELTVVVMVATWAGEVRGVALANEGEIRRRATRNTSSAPSAIPWSRNCDCLVVFSDVHFFLIRLMIPSATKPKMIPTTIDSHGNPGIPGACNVLLTTEVDTSVLVLVEVAVERVLLVLVVDSVMTLVEMEVTVVVGLVEVLVVVDEPDVMVIVVVPAPVPAPPPPIGGFNGSRWKTPASGFVTPEGPAPTAHPSCVLPGWPYTE